MQITCIGGLLRVVGNVPGVFHTSKRKSNAEGRRHLFWEGGVLQGIHNVSIIDWQSNMMELQDYPFMGVGGFWTVKVDWVSRVQRREEMERLFCCSGWAIEGMIDIEWSGYKLLSWASDDSRNWRGVGVGANLCKQEWKPYVGLKDNMK